MEIASLRQKTSALIVFMMVAATLAAIFGVQARAQVVPSTMESQLDRSYHAMYDLKFEEALRQTEAAKSLAADDPLPWAAEACIIFFRELDRQQILRIEMLAVDEDPDSRSYTWNSAAQSQFEAALSQAEKLANSRLGRDAKDDKALFALALSHSLRADDAALILKKSSAVVANLKTATEFGERLLALSPDCFDAYLATGMGKYMIGGKAAPVRWMLRLGGLKGNQEAGVKELALAADRGHYLAPFARILLVFDDLRRHDTAEAHKNMALLHDQFPHNPLFTQEIAKADRPSTGIGR